MKGKCTKADEGCTAPHGPCHESGEQHITCEHWLKNNPEQNETEQKEENPHTNDAAVPSSVNWTGAPLKMNELATITSRGTPCFIGIIGKADAGKTTFLAMLYTLLYNGKTLKNYHFAGSKTIIGWDELYQRLKVKKNKVDFPDPTPANYYRLLHIAFRNSRQQLTDVLFSDASGEVFYRWSQNKDDASAENARWIYEYANGFILFIDCEDLIQRKNAAKEEVIAIAEMLKNNLNKRPVIAVWSKADEKHNIDSRVKNALQEELKEMFENYEEIDISNFSKDDPDQLVHKNNMEVIDRMLEKIDAPQPLFIPVNAANTGDLFLNYRGHE